MQEGDRVRVKVTGRTGSIRRTFESGGQERHFVMYDESWQDRHLLRTELRPEAGEQFGEDELELL